MKNSMRRSGVDRGWNFEEGQCEIRSNLSSSKEEWRSFDHAWKKLAALEVLEV